MRLENTLKQIILENSRFNVLLDKYTKSKKTPDGKVIKPIMDLTRYIQIILADPTTKKPEGFNESDYSIENLNKIHPGEYSNWLLKQYQKPKLNNDDIDQKPGTPQYEKAINRVREIFMEDISQVTSDLTDYHKYKRYFDVSQRNIDTYTTSSLFDFILSFEVPEKFKKQEEKKEVKKQRQGFSHPGANLAFQGPNWTIMKIEDKGTAGYDAAVWFGGFRDYKHGESNWCTSDPNPSYNAFNSYIKKGPLYVILPNNDNGAVGERTGLPSNRYQFHFQDNQFMDRLDKQIDLVQFLMGAGAELKDYFKPEFAKGLTSVNGKKIEIEYPGGAAGKFVSLYGFDEFFESLPKDVTQFLFNNKSDTDLKLDIPASISQFSNLQSLLLQNCVRSLPETLGTMKELNFISLINNKHLKKLPDSIVDLPKLKMVFIKDSDNIKLSDKFLESFKEYMPGSSMYRR